MDIQMEENPNVNIFELVILNSAISVEELSYFEEDMAKRYQIFTKEIYFK